MGRTALPVITALGLLLLIPPALMGCNPVIVNPTTISSYLPVSTPPTPASTVQQPGIDVASLKESTTDNLGLYATSRNYKPVLDAGARVVNLDSPVTFFLVWVPPGYSQMEHRRVTVALHGSGGTAYAEAQDELAMARIYNYAVVGIQWWLGKPESYLSPLEVYRLTDTALRYMNYKYGADLKKVCLEGFSRGSAISYETTFYDRLYRTDYFALTVSHSGGIPGDQPTPFFRELLSGKYGPSPFQGTHFFMYCGMKDEEWGTRQCDYVSYASKIIEKYGAVIEQFIIDADGSHRGYRLTPAYNEAAVQMFLRMTSSK
jgi:hypothetical protein